MTPEHTARHVYVAHEFAERYEDALRILAREDRELTAYKEKPDHNAKAAAIREEKNERLLHFVEVAREAVVLQGEKLQAFNALESRYRLLQDEHEKLKSWARSKGLELELLPYMKLNEFRHYGL